MVEVGSAKSHTPPSVSKHCDHCVSRGPLDFEFTFAFQPIVDVRTKQVFSYEALVRGPQGQGAAWVLQQIDDENRYRFDQDCRVSAIRLAARLDVSCYLNTNLLPNAVYQPENCIRSTLAAAKASDFPINRIIFEIVENDHVMETSRLVEIMSEYKRLGFLTAFDDFGAGFAELQFLARFQPHVLKIDMDLVRGIDHDPCRQAIVRGILTMCDGLGVRALAEGVESLSEFLWLRAVGIELFQGYLIASPGFESLPQIDWSQLLS
jgi:EAL domain-containing protein (putative c-di-GMP-specific phosphodiesterase class I)